jgi:glycosyltransferase 2 family protein
MKASLLKKDTILKIIKFLSFLCVGLFLFWLVYKDQPLKEVFNSLKETNYSWLFISMVFALFSHISRALRWNILIKSLGYKAKKLNVFFAVMIMYLSNTAIPRSGEITRCGIIKKYENIPFTKLLGTVVIERIVDFGMLLIILIVVLITQFHVFVEFFNNNPAFNEKFVMVNKIEYFAIFSGIIFIFLLILFIYRKKIKNTALFKKVYNLTMSFIEGIISIKNLENRWAFIAHSLFIWSMYFLMLYVTFWSFEFTQHLSALTGLTLLVMSSIGFIAPSPGGIGTWHFMIIETLVIFGISKQPDANAFALAVHGSMTLFLVVVGFISLLIIPFINNDPKELVN